MVALLITIGTLGILVVALLIAIGTLGILVVALWMAEIYAVVHEYWGLNGVRCSTIWVLGNRGCIYWEFLVVALVPFYIVPNYIWVCIWIENDVRTQKQSVENSCFAFRAFYNYALAISQWNIDLRTKRLPLLSDTRSSQNCTCIGNIIDGIFGD